MKHLQFVKIIQLPPFTKADLSNPKYEFETQLFALSRLITNIFLTSNALRKQNRLLLVVLPIVSQIATQSFDEPPEYCVQITLDGQYLRYLAPDYKNILSLLRKPIALMYMKNGLMDQSRFRRATTPGIRFQIMKLSEIHLPTASTLLQFSENTSKLPTLEDLKELDSVLDNSSQDKEDTESTIFLPPLTNQDLPANLFPNEFKSIRFSASYSEASAVLWLMH